MSKEIYPNNVNPELSRIIHLEADEAEITISALIAHIRRLEEALEKSVIDHTTGVLNKNGYEGIVLPDLKRTLNEKAKWSILFGDLDNFKYINDNYGHTSGDMALMFVGKAINKNIRPYDHAVRWGGDEFCIFLKHPETDTFGGCETNTAEAVSSRITQTLSNSLFEEHSELSISFGTAIVKNVDDIEAAIHRADMESLSRKKSAR